MTDLLYLARLIADTLRLDAPEVAIEEGVDWPRLLDHADAHSLTPLAFATWRDRGLLGPVPSGAHERMASALRDNAARQAKVRAELLEIDSILDAAGVPHAVLKGWPLVERLYADPAHRVMYDHDFLVPPDRAPAGHLALQAAGFRPLPPKDEWVEKHLAPLWRNEGYRWDGYPFDPDYPRPVELHVRLWETGWRGLNVRELPVDWAELTTRVVAGAPMEVLSDEDTVVHLAMHFAGHLVEREPRLSQLLDLARFVSLVTDLDWDRVVARARAAGLARFVFASLLLANRIFAAPLPPSPAWQALGAETPARFAAWLAARGPADAMLADHRRPLRGRDYQLAFLAARSARERLGILRFAALPPLGQLMAKYNIPRRWLAALYYPRHIAERLTTYGWSWLRRGRAGGSLADGPK